jgi:pimeloyl-ACP methyl ester carboxylesterase
VLFTPAHRGGCGPPLLLLHGFTDTWRSWELVLPALERRHEVLAPTLAGHAGGPALSAVSEEALADELERAMDEAGFETAHLVGNSLGGYLALKLAERGRARSVLAFAPAGGWAADDGAIAAALGHFVELQRAVSLFAGHADQIVAGAEGRRRATRLTTVNYEHIPADLLAHQIVGVARCEVRPLVEYAGREGYHLDAAAIECPVRIVWGREDLLLTLPGAAVRFRDEWLPLAEWIELDGVGHCPQLDVPAETAALILEFTGSHERR